MKRVLKMLVGILLSLFLAIGIAAYSIFGGLGANVATDLPKGLGWITLDSHVAIDFISLGGGKWAMIDAGNDPSGERLLAAMRTNGVKIEDVVAILLTHGHPDHIAGIPLFPAAAVYGGAPEVPYAAGKIAFEGPLPRVMGPISPGVLIGNPVNDGDVIPLGNRTFTAYLIPGHTHGSVAWLVEGVLFIGDSASATADATLIGAPWIFSDSTEANRKSLGLLAERLRNVPVTTIVTSHSGMISGDALVEWRP